MLKVSASVYGVLNKTLFLFLLQLLKRPEYFSKFGKIHKIVVNNSTNYAGPQVRHIISFQFYSDEFQYV